MVVALPMVPRLRWLAPAALVAALIGLLLCWPVVSGPSSLAFAPVEHHTRRSTRSATDSISTAAVHDAHRPELAHKQIWQ